MVKKKPIFGAIPSLNMPKKSHGDVKVKERSTRIIVKDYEPIIKNDVYKTFKDFTSRVEKLKSLDSWSIEISDDIISMKLINVGFKLPKIHIQVDDSLGFAISAYDWFLPEMHEIYKLYTRSTRSTNIAEIIKHIQQYYLYWCIKSGMAW